MKFDDFSKMHLSLQEKNELYFGILSIMKSESDLKMASKKIFEKLSILWGQKIDDILEKIDCEEYEQNTGRRSDLAPEEKKKGTFRRIG